MPSTSVTVRMDPLVKNQAESLFEEMGLTMTTAITLFAKAVIQQRRIPFEIAAQPRYNAETEAAIQEGRDILSGKIQTKSYSSVEELWADMENDHYDDD